MREGGQDLSWVAFLVFVVCTITRSHTTLVFLTLASHPDSASAPKDFDRGSLVLKHPPRGAVAKSNRGSASTCTLEVMHMLPGEGALEEVQKHTRRRERSRRDFDTTLRLRMIRGG